MKKDNQSLSHTTWKCKYLLCLHRSTDDKLFIVRSIGEILRELCERKGVEIIEINACRDHIHILVSIPLRISVSSFISYLKRKSSLIMLDRHVNLKCRYGNRKI